MTAGGGKPASADDFRRAAARRLREGGAGNIATPDLDARLLVAEAWRRVLRVGLGDLISWAEATVPRAEQVHVEAVLAGLLQQRLDGAPVARLTGSREFWSLSLQLSADSLEPRPDTETVVEAALAALDGRTREALTIVDLGVGSGAILLALLAELPMGYGVGIDLSEGAVRTARENANKLGFAARSAFAQGHWGDALTAGSVDLLVSNPPYIATAEIESLPVEVRRHDPRLALDGGGDGLDAYRAILADLSRMLAANGVAVLELGAGQGPAVGKIAEGFGFSTATRADLSGIPRAMTLRRRVEAASTRPKAHRN